MIIIASSLTFPTNIRLNAHSISFGCEWKIYVYVQFQLNSNSHLLFILHFKFGATKTKQKRKIKINADHLWQASQSCYRGCYLIINNSLNALDVLVSYFVCVLHCTSISWGWSQFFVPSSLCAINEIFPLLNCISFLHKHQNQK